jgi:CP family cyanate transporter-like MFS transporter
MSSTPLRRVLITLGILVLGANLRAALTTVGPLLDQVRDDLHLSATTASALVSLPVLCFAFFSPVVPAIARRLGLERTLGAALAVLAVGIALRSVPWMPGLWIGTVLLGCAIATLNVLLPALVKRDFPHTVGRATGAYSVAQSLFAALAAGIAVPIAGTTDHGWRLAFGMWAGLALIGLAVMAPQMLHRTAPMEPAEHDARGPSPWRAARAWQVTLFLGTQSVLYYTVITLWPTIEESHGVASGTAGAHQSVLQICGILGNVGAGWAIQRRHRDQRAIVLPLVVLAMLGVGGELVAPGLSLLWCVLIGVATGGSIVLALAFFGLRTRHHGTSASLSGMAQSVGYLIAAGGPLAIAALHDATGAWTLPLLILLTLQLVQLATGLLAARPGTID